MREAVTKKIPITLILGDNEKDNNTISFRRYKEEKTTTLSKDEFIKLIKNEIETKKI